MNIVQWIIIGMLGFVVLLILYALFAFFVLDDRTWGDSTDDLPEGTREEMDKEYEEALYNTDDYLPEGYLHGDEIPK